MDKYISWDTIANSFYAADKIRNLIISPSIENRSSSIFESNYSTIIEVLRVISEYSSGTHKKLLNNIVGKSDLYSNTYRNLKNHINLNSNRNMNFDDITKALSIIRPILNNNPRTTIEKILKIYEIIKS